MRFPFSIAQITPVSQQNLNELNYKESCLYATTGDLDATLTNGQILTCNSPGVLKIDGSTDVDDPDYSNGTKLPNIVVGNRILVQSQTNTEENGIYTVSNIGDGSNPWVLIRADDFNNPSECPLNTRSMVFISKGQTNSDKDFLIVSIKGGSETVTTFGTTKFIVSVPADAAVKIRTNDSENSNENFYPVLTKGNVLFNEIVRADKLPYNDVQLSYNPSNNTLTTHNAILNQNLNVTGDTTLTGTLGVGGDTTLSSNASVTGDTTLTGALGVSGVTTLSSNASVGGTLGVSGVTTLSSNASVGGTLGVSGVTTLSNDLAINDGSTTNFSVTQSNGNTSVAGTLDVGGDTTLTGALGVSGVTTLSSNASVGGTLGVSGVTTLSSNASVVGTLGVGGDTTLNGDVTLGAASTDAITINGNVNSFTMGGGQIITGDVTGNASGLSVPLAVISGGTGSTSKTGARTNLGLGTMATENVAALTNSIIPDTSETIDLGSNDKRFRDLYLSGSTLNLGNIKLQDNSGELIVKNSSDHQLHHTNILKHIIYDPSSQTTITLNEGSWKCIQNFKTSFTTPAGCTEVIVEAGVFFYPGSNTAFGLSLSSNSSGNSYTEWSSLHSGRNTERQIYYTYYSTRKYATTEWHLTGLTANTEYDINLAFKRWSGANTAYVMIGGSYPKGFMKVKYLHNGFDTDAESEYPS